MQADIELVDGLSGNNPQREVGQGVDRKLFVGAVRQRLLQLQEQEETQERRARINKEREERRLAREGGSEEERRLAREGGSDIQEARRILPRNPKVSRFNQPTKLNCK